MLHVILRLKCELDTGVLVVVKCLQEDSLVKEENRGEGVIGQNLIGFCQLRTASPNITKRLGLR